MPFTVKTISSPYTVNPGEPTNLNPDINRLVNPPNNLKGDTGPTGPTGPQGNIGPTSPIGLTGNKGDTGPTGPQGLNGPIGISNVPGPTGPTGNTGLIGPTGPSGVSNVPGPTGNTGLIGPTGLNGNDGAQGLIGPTGPTGVTGNTGLNGNNGTQGLIGPTGPTGSQGLIGNTGNIGLKGDTGNIGLTGNDGLIGPTGPTGLIGNDGIQGPIGLTGNTGLIGPTGPTGANSVNYRLNKNLGLIIPFYQYPSNVYTNTNINALLDTIRVYKSVATTVIVNPASGPGTVTDGNYTALIKRLRGAGAKVLAYVATTNATKDIALVEADITSWLSLYSDIDGVFIDEMDNSGTTTSVNYYKSLTDFSHNLNLFPVIGNPGTGLPETYFINNTVDISIINESDGYPTEAFISGNYGGGYADYDPINRAAVVYNVPLTSSQIALIAKYVGNIYVTDALGSNPYGTLPTYLTTLYSQIVLANSGVLT